jgi:single-strand DNA-binding protein
VLAHPTVSQRDVTRPDWQPDRRPRPALHPNGNAVANFRLAVTARVKDGDSWRDGDTSYFRINVWRQLAEHVAESLTKGDRAVVIGRLKSRSWETPEGDKRWMVEVDEVAPSLRWAIAKPQRAANGGKGKSSGEFNDDAPSRLGSAPATPAPWWPSSRPGRRPPSTRTAAAPPRPTRIRRPPHDRRRRRPRCRQAPGRRPGTGLDGHPQPPPRRPPGRHRGSPPAATPGAGG